VQNEKYSDQSESEGISALESARAMMRRDKMRAFRVEIIIGDDYRCTDNYNCIDNGRAT